MSFLVRNMSEGDLEQAASIQKLAFPPPFSEDLHWRPEHLREHILLFPQAQWVAESAGRIVATCSNTLISEERWLARENWYLTVGGTALTEFTEQGTTLYGIDIAVHPDFRRRGIGRAFYEARFEFVRTRRLVRYGTACRIPDYREHGLGASVEAYASAVARGEKEDRTLTPLLRYGLTFLGIIRNYMPDYESDDSAALLEWRC